MVNDSTTEEIKNRLDLKDLIGEYVQLQKRGVNFAARCPFHNEKTPSFFVSPARQVWRCFGCGEGGDHFTFIERIEGVDFPEALRLLAVKAGVEIKRQNPQVRTEKNKSLEINTLAAQYFHQQLNSKNGQKIMQYLKERGLNDASIKNFLLGYAPHNGRALVEFLVGHGYAPAELERAGISFALQRSGEHLCRFRGRIMFPIFNTHGDIVGFGARLLTEELAKQIAKEVPQDTGKYINTPQTNIYDKGKLLYGLDKAKMPIHQKDFSIVVEGYMDAILAHQAGYDNVVAASGTSLTEEQLNILGRFSKNLFTAFDMDIAGDSATKRGIDLAQKMGYNIKVITLSEGKDPADVIKDNPDVWRKQVEAAENVTEFYFNNALKRHDYATAEGKRLIGIEFAPVIAGIASRIEQAHWTQKLSSLIKVSPEDVWAEVRKAAAHIVAQPKDTSGSEVRPQPISRRDLIAQHIMLAFLQQPHLYSDFEKLILELPEFNAAHILQTCFDKNKKQFNINLLADDERSLAEQLLLESEVYNRLYSKEDLEQFLINYKKISFEDELRSLEEQIRINEDAGNVENNKALLSDFQKKAEQLSQLIQSNGQEKTN